MLGKLIKQAAESFAEEAVSFGVVSGTVVSPSPLTVRVDERFTLTDEHLLLPSYLRGVTLSVVGKGIGKATLFAPLKAGDKLILLAGEGRYLVLGKEEENGTEIVLTLS